MEYNGGTIEIISNTMEPDPDNAGVGKREFIGIRFVREPDIFFSILRPFLLSQALKDD